MSIYARSDRLGLLTVIVRTNLLMTPIRPTGSGCGVKGVMEIRFSPDARSRILSRRNDRAMTARRAAQIFGRYFGATSPETV